MNSMQNAISPGCTGLKTGLLTFPDPPPHSTFDAAPESQCPVALVNPSRVGLYLAVVPLESPWGAEKRESD